MAGQHAPVHRGFDWWYGLPLSHDYGCTDNVVPNITFGAGWEYNSDQSGAPCNPCPTKNEDVAVTSSGNTTCNIGYPNNWDISPPLYRCHAGAPCASGAIIEQPVDERTLSTRYAKEAIGFVQNASKSDAPWFLYMAMSHMHTPQQASAEFVGKSKRKGAHYGDVLGQLDHSIGLVVDALTALKLRERTLIFVTGDNGTPDDTCHSLVIDNGFTGSNGPFLGSWVKNTGGGSSGKATIWEGGHREVGLFSMPGTIAPGVSHALASTMDIVPTFLALAGVQLPSDGRVFDGVDLGPVLRGTVEVVRTSLVHPSQNPVAGSLRTVRLHEDAHKWKLLDTESFHHSGGCWAEPTGVGVGGPYRPLPTEDPLIFDLAGCDPDAASEGGPAGSCAEAVSVNATLSKGDFTALVAKLRAVIKAKEASIASTPRSVADYTERKSVMLEVMCCNASNVACRCHVRT